MAFRHHPRLRLTARTSGGPLVLAGPRSVAAGEPLIVRNRARVSLKSAAQLGLVTLNLMELSKHDGAP